MRYSIAEIPPGSIALVRRRWPAPPAPAANQALMWRPSHNIALLVAGIRIHNLAYLTLTLEPQPLRHSRRATRRSHFLVMPNRRVVVTLGRRLARTAACNNVCSGGGGVGTAAGASPPALAALGSHPPANWSRPQEVRQLVVRVRLTLFKFMGLPNTRH